MDSKPDMEEIIEITAPRVRRWLHETIEGIVNDTMEIEVSTDIQPELITLKVRVAKEDLGQVIGKQGRIARSLRTLLQARGGRDGVRYALDIAAHPQTIEAQKEVLA